jgi:two-component system, OmpR family, sensor histidine kinase ChvG
MALATAAARRVGRAVLRFGARLARIKYRLLLINVIVAAVPLVGISFARLHEQQLLAALETDMVHQAEIVRAMLTSEPELRLDHGLLLASAAHDTRTRIRLLDEHGVVVADSHTNGPPEGAESPVPHLLSGEAPTHAAGVPKPVDVVDRVEVREALAGHYGSATRLWGKQDRVYLFAALPVVRDGRVAAVVYVTRSTHDVKLQLLTLRTWLARLLIATVVITALITLLLATTIARPLGRLTRRAQRIAARQPAEPDRLAERHDEIGQLARAVGAMTEELERRAHDARTLAADISHEFKTPLTGIRGAAELLRDGAAEDPDARDRFLAMIVEDTARLDRLVSRLLELARVEDDRGTPLPVDLVALARSCAARTWPVEVVAEADAIVPIVSIVYGRTVALAAALENLVANATQHAEPGSIVRVTLTSHRDAVRITVTNHGTPVSPAAQARVWDRFYSTRTDQGGSGLGLAIVRSVALAHGGAVGVRCAQGVTAFWFEIKSRT